MQRIVAPNASPMTFTGTNTYLVGERDIAVVDPGPDNDRHLQAILDALPSRSALKSILVTHSHVDHTALAPRLAEATDARIFAHAGSPAAIVTEEFSSEAALAMGGGEGVDRRFKPDIQLSEGQIIRGGNWSLEVLWTPGHFHNHVCLAWPEGSAVFTGDHVMGWSTTTVSPPHGNMTDFMHSLKRLAMRGESVFYPGHGDRIDEPQAMISHQIGHRNERERQILQAIQSEPLSAEEVAARIYDDISPRLLAAAARNVFAHFLDLHGRGIVRANGVISGRSRFSAI